MAVGVRVMQSVHDATIHLQVFMLGVELGIKYYTIFIHQFVVAIPTCCILINCI